MSELDIKTKRGYFRKAQKEGLVEEILSLCLKVDGLHVPSRVLAGSQQDAVEFKTRVCALIQVKNRTRNRVSAKMPGARLVSIRDDLASAIREVI